MKARLGSACLIAIAILVAPISNASAQDADLMSEGELAIHLVKVLGLSAMLPANPTKAEAIGILLQNGVRPADGWNTTNLVTVGTLARIVVQSMGAEDDIAEPRDDEAYVEYLTSIGIEFGTINDAMVQIEPIPQPIANEAIKVTTDPLKKESFIRPIDEQQSGADLQIFRKVVPAAEINELFLAVPVVRPLKPDVLTPN